MALLYHARNLGQHVLNRNAHGLTRLNVNHGDLTNQACVHHEARAEATHRVEVPTGALLKAHAPVYGVHTGVGAVVMPRAFSNGLGPRRSLSSVLASVSA